MFKSLVVFFICQQCVFGEFDSVVYLRRRTAAVRARSLGRSTPSVAPQSRPGSAVCGTALSVRRRSASREDKSGAAGDRNINVSRQSISLSLLVFIWPLKRLWAAAELWAMCAWKLLNMSVIREITSSCRIMAEEQDTSHFSDDTDIPTQHGHNMELVFHHNELQLI